jgi:hypothetical protein
LPAYVSCYARFERPGRSDRSRSSSAATSTLQPRAAGLVVDGGVGVVVAGTTTGL